MNYGYCRANFCRLVVILLHYTIRRRSEVRDGTASGQSSVQSSSITCETEVTSRHEEELTDVEFVDATDGTQIWENGLHLWPVRPLVEGEGLPYAPVNWPNEGDIWGWRAGERVGSSGYYLDRYLYLPMRFWRFKPNKDGFKSKLSVEQYIKARYPNCDVNAFFSSFSWKIPSQQAYNLKEEIVEQYPSLLPGVGCKAGNILCSSLVDQTHPSLKPAQPCDVCCSEHGFCQKCSCILCSKSIDFGFGGYSFIRCEATVHGDLICGHVAHVNCALLASMAGTVGLDTEYYCRRCDSRTDLTNHIMSLLKTCESIDSRESIEKMLIVGVCILCGSQKTASQKLLKHIESILEKVKVGCDLKDVWKERVDTVPISSGERDSAGQKDNDNSSCQNVCLNLDMEIHQVIEMFKSAQEVEFKFMEDLLNTQKDLVYSLQKQLNKEKAELKCPTPSSDRDALLRSIAAREELIEHELRNFRDMKKVAYAKSPGAAMKDYFVE